MLALECVGNRVLLLSLSFIVTSVFGQAQETVRVPTDALQPPEEILDPHRANENTISMADAVRITLEHDPQILLSKQDVSLAMARFQESSGIFDGRLQAAPSFRYEWAEMRPAVRQREIDKRAQLDTVATVFKEVRRELKIALESDSLRGPRCPESFEFVDAVLLDGLDEAEIDIIGVDRPLTIIVDDDIESSIFEFETICAPITEFSFPDIQVDFLEGIRNTLDLGIDDIITDLSQFPRGTVALSHAIADAVTTRARLGFLRLGLLPIDEITKSISIEAAFQKSLRNGISFTIAGRLESSQHNFRDKPLDPRFGGFGLQNNFPSFISGQLDVPLQKGFGKITAQAPERVAELSVNAERERMRHVITEEVFRTVLSYLNLVAAQDTLSLLEESATRQQRFLDLAKQLIAADEIPRSELVRSLARLAQVESGVHSSRQSLITSQLGLSEGMGLYVTNASEAPLASDQFSKKLVSLPGAEVLLRTSEVSRRDSRALSILRNASRILAEASQNDLKRRLDLTVTVGMTTFHESGFFRFLPDELEKEDLPPEAPAHFYSPRGFTLSAFQSNWEPFITGSITFELPFGNNVAQGRHFQDRSSLRSSDIQFGDLRRLIRDNVVDVSVRLERAAESVRHRRESIGFYKQTLEAAQARFEINDISLIDVLLTEEDLTQAQLQLVQDWRTYFSLLARLKFEVGDLVIFQDLGLPVENSEFRVVDFVAP